MVLLAFLFLGAIDEELRGVPKRKRKFRVGFTKKEQRDLNAGKFPQDDRVFKF
jgi:hypothetical protein